MKVLFVTNMWPDEERPWYRTFIKTQADSLEEVASDWRLASWHRACLRRLGAAMSPSASAWDNLVVFAARNSCLRTDRGVTPFAPGKHVTRASMHALRSVAYMGGPSVRALLACPCCHEALSDSPSGLRCCTCGRGFSYAESGVPILFPDSTSVVYSEGETLFHTDRPWLVSKVKPLLTPPSLKVTRTLHDELRERVVFGARSGAVILNLGSGTIGRFRDKRFVNFDIFPHDNTDVVGDGHHLPFLAESFDVVWLAAVLEHIRKPWQVASEVLRVLRPGGEVLISAPFIQEQHGAPHDYFRYTVDGLRSVFEEFEEIEAGPTFTGPTGTLIHVGGAWARAMVPGRLGLGLQGLVVRGLAWLRYLDLLSPARTRQVEVLNGGSCFLGRKPSVCGRTQVRDP